MRVVESYHPTLNNKVSKHTIVKCQNSPLRFCEYCNSSSAVVQVWVREISCGPVFTSVFSCYYLSLLHFVFTYSSNPPLQGSSCLLHLLKQSVEMVVICSFLQLQRVKVLLQHTLCHVLPMKTHLSNSRNRKHGGGHTSPQNNTSSVIIHLYWPNLLIFPSRVFLTALN